MHLHSAWGLLSLLSLPFGKPGGRCSRRTGLQIGKLDTIGRLRKRHCVSCRSLTRQQGCHRLSVAAGSCLADNELLLSVRFLDDPIGGQPQPHISLSGPGMASQKSKLFPSSEEAEELTVLLFGIHCE